MFKVINNKVNYNDRNEEKMRQHQTWLPSVPLTNGKFSDTGYRYRKNNFFFMDYWIPVPFVAGDDITFYDITPFNSDTLDVGPDFPLLAEMYFRIDTDELAHVRKVYEFMDFLGDVGGVIESLMRASIFLFGGYLAWNSDIETMIEMYSSTTKMNH